MEIRRNLISRKKPTYAVSEYLSEYLGRYGRLASGGVRYDDLARYAGQTPLYDEHGAVLDHQQLPVGPSQFISFHASEAVIAKVLLDVMFPLVDATTRSRPTSPGTAFGATSSRSVALCEENALTFSFLIAETAHNTASDAVTITADATYRAPSGMLAIKALKSNGKTSLLI